MSKKIYKIQYRDPKNVLWIGKIEDANNPYNIIYSFHDNGDSTTTYSFAFDPLPPDAYQTQILWSTNGGATWTGNTGGTTSPRSVTLPSSIYWFKFLVFRSAGWEEFDITGEASEQEITGGDNAIEISFINNDESKFATIAAKQCVIKFLSTSAINLNTFAQGPVYDNRFYVEVAVNTEDNVVFKGFLSMGDLSEPFLSPRNIVTLTATDKLGSLKTVPLVDFDDKNPAGHFTIAKYFAYSLRKTGLDLPIHVISNLRHEHRDDETWFHHTYLWSKTFEDQVNTCINSYEVMERILKYHGRIWQRNGAWYIMWIDEFDQHPIYISTFDKYGEMTDELDGADYVKEIKREYPMWFSNKNTRVILNGQHKFVKLTFNYNLPRELLCNFDFSRGDLLEVVSATESRFEIDCWNLVKDLLPPSWPVAATESTAYIKRVYTNSYETERYAVLTPATHPNPVRLESEPIVINQKDKFLFNYQFKWSQNISGSAIDPQQFHVVLLAYDGTVWFVDEDGKWYQSDTNWSINLKRHTKDWIPDDVNETEWQSFGMIECEPAPRSGKIIIAFYWNNYAALSSIELHIAPVSFELIPFINGSYAKYSGQYNKVEQAGKYNDSIDDEVYISESPNPNYKGSLLRKEGDNYLPVGNFYPANIWHDAPPDPEYWHTFSWLRVYAVFNQVKQVTRTFRINAQGLDAASLDAQNKCDMPDALQTFRLLDPSPHTNDKDFMLLSARMDTKWSGWSGVLKEVYNRATGKLYNDPIETKYISE